MPVYNFFSRFNVLISLTILDFVLVFPYIKRLRRRIQKRLKLYSLCVHNVFELRYTKKKIEMPFKEEKRNLVDVTYGCL